MTRKTQPTDRRTKNKAHDKVQTTAGLDKAGDRRRGLRAETLCCWWLRAKAYRIMARNWRHKTGEIDIIARRGRLLVFVEVKMRPTLGLAQQAVSAGQQTRITAAAQRFVAARPSLHRHQWRFDVMACAPGHWPKHIEDVWRAR